MTKTELLAKLNSSDELVKLAYVPVSEVIKWVDELEDDTVNISDELIDSIVDEICGMGLDLIDDYTLEMSYREVELDGIDISDSAVERAVKRAIQKQ
jgi:SAM-dependent methyltransferase